MSTGVVWSLAGVVGAHETVPEGMGAGAVWGLVGVVVLILAVATGIGQSLARQPDLGLNAAAIAAFNARVRAAWVSCALLAGAFLFPRGVTVTVFGLISFWALREFITLTPTRKGDHRALFWVFFFFTPLQYVLVGMDKIELYSVMIPVFAFLFIPARIAIADDAKRFLERVAKIQCGLLISVYCLSFAPALLYLKGGTQTTWGNAGLLLFFIIMVQFADALQYVWGRIYGTHPIAPSINASRTWEGFLLGSGCAALVGMSLWWATPFNPLQAAGMSLLIGVMAAAGGLTMSAVKRDRGVKDYGTLVEGHGGVLDRIDSICFAAPVFYYVTWLLLR